MARSIAELRGRDAILSEEEYRDILQKAVLAVRYEAIVREEFPDWFKAPVGWKTEHKYFSQVDVSEAQMDTTFRDLITDSVDRTSATVQILKLERDFFVSRYDLELAKEVGRDLVAENVESCGYRIGQLENEYIFKGLAEDGTNYDIQGLYEIAGNDYSTTKDFGTYGNPLLAVKGGIALLQTDLQYGPYKLFLNPVQNNELMTSHSSTGVPEVEKVNRVLNAKGVGKTPGPLEGFERIFSLPYLTAGDGMLIGEADKQAISIIPGIPLQFETYGLEANKGKGISGRVFESLALVVAHTNNVCKLSDI